MTETIQYGQFDFSTATSGSYKPMPVRMASEVMLLLAPTLCVGVWLALMTFKEILGRWILLVGVKQTGRFAPDDSKVYQ